MLELECDCASESESSMIYMPGECVRQVGHRRTVYFVEGFLYSKIKREEQSRTQHIIFTCGITCVLHRSQIRREQNARQTNIYC